MHVAPPRSVPPHRPAQPPSSRSPATNDLSHVAFLGLGHLGAPMARRLSGSFPLVVWNRTAASADGFVAAGARIARTPRECARGAHVVLTCLSDGRALEQVLGGDEGILAGVAPDAVVVDMSTIGRAAAREAARAVTARGARFVDAPVSGTAALAESGEIVALVGGAEADVARVEPVLRAMCNRVVRAGGVGQGQALQVVINGVAAHHLIAFASMLALGERAGLARQIIVDAFTSGVFATPAYASARTGVLARRYDPEHTLALVLKDGALNMALQQEVGLTLPVHREIARELARAVGEGLGGEGPTALEKYFARK